MPLGVLTPIAETRRSQSTNFHIQSFAADISRHQKSEMVDRRVDEAVAIMSYERDRDTRINVNSV